MIARILVTAVLMVTITVALAWWSWTSEHRPRHADAGIGALTVAQLHRQLRSDIRGPTSAPEPIAWPTVDLDEEAPGSSYLPGTDSESTRWSAPTPEHLQRVLDGLRRL